MPPYGLCYEITQQNPQKKTSNLQDPLNEFCNGHVLLHGPWAKKNLPSCGRCDFSNAKQAHLKFLQKSNGF